MLVERYIKFIVATTQVVVFCFGAQASQSVLLGWNPSPDPKAVGYAIYYGNATDAYSHRLDVGTNTTAVVAGLTEGQTYFFVVVACDAQGDESPPSNEVSHPIPRAADNRPPTLDPLNNLLIDENAGLQTVNLSGIASGTTNEVQPLSVSAASGDPALVPDPAVSYVSPSATGILSFTPTTDAFGSAVITVIVNDGQPPNSTVSRSFRVSIRPTVAQLSIGSTALQAGQIGSVPINFSSSAGVTNLSIVLDLPPGRLSDFALEGLLPEIDPVSATVTPRAGPTTLLHLAARSGQVILGSGQIAQLAFRAIPGRRSAFVPLQVLQFTVTKADGSVLSNRPAASGRVVVINQESLVEVSYNANGTPKLTLHGKPFASYTIEYATNLGTPTTWTPLTSTISPVTTSTLVPGLDPAPSQIFYRARESPDAP